MQREYEPDPATVRGLRNDIEVLVRKREKIDAALSYWLRAEVRRELKANREQLKALGLLEA
jgi:hypothetical protein